MDRAVTRIAAVFLGVCAACGGPAKEGPQGAACFRASECEPGLVCIAQQCTNDLTSVDIHEDAGAAGAAMVMMPAGDASTGAGGGGSGSGGAGGASGAGGAGGGKAGAGGSGGKGGSGGAGGSAMAGMAGSGNVNDASAD